MMNIARMESVDLFLTFLTYMIGNMSQTILYHQSDYGKTKNAVSHNYIFYTETCPRKKMILLQLKFNIFDA